MEVCLRERESEVTKMAQVSLIKTKLAQPGVAFFPSSVHILSIVMHLFCFVFFLSFPLFFFF